jgi:hypothetical protein
LGCANPPNDADTEALNEAAAGGLARIDPTLIEPARELAGQALGIVEALAGQIFNILPPSAFEFIEANKSEIRILPASIPQDVTPGCVVEHLRTLNQKDIVLFEDKGQIQDLKVATRTKYLSLTPPVDDRNALAQPWFPTVENLQRMLSRRPRSPLGPLNNALELHHYQQKAERLIPMRPDVHRGQGLTKLLHSYKALPSKDRQAFRLQRDNIWRAYAVEYLPEEYVDIIKQLPNTINTSLGSIEELQ